MVTLRSLFKLTKRRAWIFGNGIDYREPGWELSWADECGKEQFVWVRHLVMLGFAYRLFPSKGSYPFPYNGLLGLWPWPPKIDETKLWQEPLIENRFIRVAWGRGAFALHPFPQPDGAGFAGFRLRVPTRDGYSLNTLLKWPIS